MKPARYFLNRMLNTLRTGHGHTTITLDPEFHRDLRWFERFLPLYNGVSLYDHKKCDHQVHLDACLQGLVGGSSKILSIISKFLMVIKV